jgi:hypothetical protein
MKSFHQYIMMIFIDKTIFIFIYKYQQKNLLDIYCWNYNKKIKNKKKSNSTMMYNFDRRYYQRN